MQRRIAVIAYDIASNRTRRAVLKVLREWRLDGQKSVHECLLSDAEAAELFIQLGEQIDPDTDRLLLAWLPPRRGMHARGLGRTDSQRPSLLRVH
ncbi:CRISPR-associated endonuclease Cas2 [uncultured Thiohalocapsa sp.]|uniref:CRISPR-associated endonuclease Cas2 n=1 Tax=uncultured Thiohalocapsa sp. TaxID=768990 RepID=UPI0025F5328E|nr:CRISPR-associated endonuclease Cas2 [uncultured Thiohalocapsa sp.]